MKKVAVIAISMILLAALTGLAYFFIVPQKTTTIANEPARSPAPELKSFRGVLADVLNEVKEEVVEIKQEIAEAIPNPFSDNPPSGENNLTFAILGDTQSFKTGNPRGSFQKAIARIREKNPDLVIAVGYLTNGCESKNECTRELTDWKNITGNLFEKTYAVQGNNDAEDDSNDGIWQNTFNFPANGPEDFSEFTYSLDVKNSHFVFLSSDRPEERKINSSQRNWLEQDLAKNKKENVFVVFHEPAYPVSNKMGESLDTNPSDRNALWQILKKYNVTAVFNGHEHIVSRRKVGKIYQFVFGSTDSFDHGLPAAGVAEYASLGQGRYGIVKVNGKEITVETRGPDGKIFDTFTFSK